MSDSSDQYGNGSGTGNGAGNGGSAKGKKPKPRNAQLTAAADVLQALLQNSKSQLSDGFMRWRLEKEWSQIVGPTIGEQTVPCAYERGTLFIWVRHSAWMQQLWFFQDAIREKVNNHVGKDWAKQVKFTLNRRAAENLPPGR